VTGVVRVVTDATFADVVLGSALPCLVEFRDDAVTLDDADWLTSYAGTNRHLTCARLDVSTSPQTARTYGVGAVPTYVVFRLGAVVSAVAGPEDLPTLLATMAGPPTDGSARRADEAPAPS